MSSSLSTRYSHKEMESRWYAQWEAGGYFRPASDSKGKKSGDRRYVIVIPPPNVTGILHMGHALNNSIQDIMIRWHRMKGDDTLWVPGVDHAGIATQNVVEKKLAKNKQTRDHLGRKKFLEEVWKWKEDHGSTITRQLRRLGASCDWSRERFTMDEGLSLAVRECFVTLHERGLIYRGNYIINWCPRCQTALSDEEAAHKDVHGGLYHIKYPIAGAGKKAERIGVDHIVIATTRPETMLGDVAVAIHPGDGRYRGLVGKKLILPLLEREIPIIEDEFVDPEFGTGMVKVTPAHDPNDFEMGKRHDLPQINVMHVDGKINSHGGPYSGLDRFEARKKVVKDLEDQGLFIKRDTHLHAVGHCYRCDTIVEPYLSKQWFVRMKPLAEKALAAHRAGKTVFYPDRWTKVYTNWLENIRDWCISRQIWWGHQIPVWYCGQCRKGDEDDSQKGIVVSRETPQKCPECGNSELVQDPDVLDTWFSSWLWPFSTLGWPEKTEDLKHFYPTSDLITAPEIIFFWVARMIMAGLEFMQEVPFNRIYLHGTVRAQSGLKMSKSLGNAIDPLEVIDGVGADALRFSLVMLSAQDVYLSTEKFDMGRNFTNKIWNASRFVLMNLEGFKEGATTLDVDRDQLPISCRWILSAYEAKAKQADQYLSSGFYLAQAASELYHFIWNDFCDWFIELAKPALAGEDASEKLMAQKVLFCVLEKILCLLHPFMPFVTEEIWQKLREMAKDGETWPKSLMLASWPEPTGYRDVETERHFMGLQDAVGAVRDLRAKFNIPPSQEVSAVLKASGAAGEMFKVFSPCVERLGKVKLEIKSDFERTKAYVGNSFADFEIFMSIEGLVDADKEKERIEKKIQETVKWVTVLNKKLSNDNFVRNAPKDVIDKEKEKLVEAEKILKSYQEHLRLI
ncbi:MAG: valine--tRNA ligase [Candidatus Omnitrophota bacterium]|nr:valine--tRNA ligase [Candidatus Omnitrophota bacterium]